MVLATPLFYYCPFLNKCCLVLICVNNFLCPFNVLNILNISDKKNQKATGIF